MANLYYFSLWPEKFLLGKDIQLDLPHFAAQVSTWMTQGGVKAGRKGRIENTVLSLAFPLKVIILVAS